MWDGCSGCSARHAGSCCCLTKSSRFAVFSALIFDLQQVVTPWDVSGGTDGKIDYDKLTREVSPFSHMEISFLNRHTAKSDPGM